MLEQSCFDAMRYDYSHLYLYSGKGGVGLCRPERWRYWAMDDGGMMVDLYPAGGNSSISVGSDTS